MAKNENIWKFNDEEWKVHFTDIELLERVKIKFDLEDLTTIYYESGSLSEETSWDIIVPNDKINEVKKFIKDNT
jgi:zona occludens toxin (predicted ATPase)|tara:strand:+ start:433 stop:654 length:222 start_codon:yes stop_codon:yes gene_type:complete